MDCDRAAELLPWYLNGSLEEADRRDVESHLETCDRCRAELRDSEAAFTLYGGHPPTRLLVDFGFDRPDVPRDLVEAHLPGCDRCAAELALVRQSRGGLGAEQRAEDGATVGSVVPFRRAAGVAGGWRTAAVAAALAGLIGLGGWSWTWRQLASGQEQIADLRDRVGELDAPRPNVPILDLWPEDGLLLRSGAAAANPLEVAGAGGGATLILNTELPAGTEIDRLELRDRSDRLLATVRGLRRAPEDGFTLSLPPAQLPPGPLRILLYGTGGGEALESYTLELR